MRMPSGSPCDRQGRAQRVTAKDLVPAQSTAVTTASSRNGQGPPNGRPPGGPAFIDWSNARAWRETVTSPKGQTGAREIVEIGDPGLRSTFQQGLDLVRSVLGDHQFQSGWPIDLYCDPACNWTWSAPPNAGYYEVHAKLGTRLQIATQFAHEATHLIAPDGSLFEESLAGWLAERFASQLWGQDAADCVRAYHANERPDCIAAIQDLLRLLGAARLEATLSGFPERLDQSHWLNYLTCSEQKQAAAVLAPTP